VTNHNLAQARLSGGARLGQPAVARIEQQKRSWQLAKKGSPTPFVRSPISGAVKEKHASRGSYLTVNGRIVTLSKINPLRFARHPNPVSRGRPKRADDQPDR